MIGGQGLYFASVWGRGESKDYAAVAADPYEFFRHISAVNSVTTSEDRLFGALLSYWKDYRERDPSKRDRLTIRRVGKAQVAVQWRGLPDTRRGIVCVAHTDREGFLLSEHSVQNDRSIKFKGLPANGGSLDRASLGAEVVVAVGTGKEVHRCLGRIVEHVTAAGKAWSPGSGEKPEHCFVQTAPLRHDALAEAGGRLSQGEPATANYAFDFSDRDSPRGDLGTLQKTSVAHRLDEDSGDLRASCLDNFAGVSAATSALTRVVEKGMRANLTVLYSIGEEARMLGMLDILMNEPLFLMDSLAQDDLWLVLDSSDVNHSYSVSLEAWARARRDNLALGPVPPMHDADGPAYEDDRMEAPEFGPCSDELCSVRLEDKATIFDPGVARFLFQAQIGSLALMEQRIQSTPTVRARIERYRGRDWIRRHPILPGMFQGGVCEATPLGLLGQIGEALGQPLRTDRRLTIGSVAIPLWNYRCVAGDSRVTPERTHYMALLSAAALVDRAAELFPYARLAGRGAPRFRSADSDSRMSSSVAEAVERTRDHWNRPETQKHIDKLADWLGPECPDA